MRLEGGVLTNLILRDAAEFIIGPRFARTRWRLLTMRKNLLRRFAIRAAPWRASAHRPAAGGPTTTACRRTPSGQVPPDQQHQRLVIDARRDGAVGRGIAERDIELTCATRQ